MTPCIRSREAQGTYLSSSLSVCQLLLKDDEHQTKGSHDETVTSITKHDSKQEREGDDGVGGWEGER